MDLMTGLIWIVVGVIYIIYKMRQENPEYYTVLKAFFVLGVPVVLVIIFLGSLGDITGSNTLGIIGAVILALGGLAFMIWLTLDFGNDVVSAHASKSSARHTWYITETIPDDTEEIERQILKANRKLDDVLYRQKTKEYWRRCLSWGNYPDLYDPKDDDPWDIVLNERDPDAPEARKRRWINNLIWQEIRALPVDRATVDDLMRTYKHVEYDRRGATIIWRWHIRKNEYPELLDIPALTAKLSAEYDALHPQQEEPNENMHA